MINYLDPSVAMRQGGPLMWPILLCSIVSITFALERFISLRRARVAPRSFARKFVRKLRSGELDRGSAMEMCRSNNSALAGVFLGAVRHWGKPTADIERAITEAGGRQVGLLKRNLRVLQTSANLATLLGLLGTILGMIEAFNAVANAHGMERSEVLANGIAEALLTTAGGLVVAIPSLFLHGYFVGRIERLVREMDELADVVLDEISAESLAGKSQARENGVGEESEISSQATVIGKPERRAAV